MQADDFLGTLSAETIKTFASNIKDVSREQFVLARAAWAAFRQPTPEGWAALLSQDLSPLPYLEPAVRRMLQELPGARSGLARTQYQILLAINESVGEPRLLFGAVEKMERAAFMGDWSFWRWLDGMSANPGALIESLEGRFSPDMSEDDFKAYVTSPLKLTKFGLQVLGGAADYASEARVDRWIGGTHLTIDNLWRWDDQKRELMALA